MRSSSAKRFKGTLAVASLWTVVVWMVMCSSGCDSQPPHQVVEPADSLGTQDSAGSSVESSPKTDDFSSFVGLFKPSSSFSNWPELGQQSLVADGNWFEGGAEERLLSRNYVPIGPELHRWIPMEKVARLDRSYTAISAPSMAFHWYAFRRIERPGFSIVGMFAHKQNGNQGGEYNAHPFLLATYSEEGDIKDSHVWWLIEDDDLQVWSDISVRGDTLITGHRPLPEEFDAPMDEIFSKVVVGGDGKFKILLSNEPKPSEG